MPDDFNAKRESLLKYLVDKRNAVVLEVGKEGKSNLDLARDIKELNELIDAVEAVSAVEAVAKESTYNLDNIG